MVSFVNFWVDDIYTTVPKTFTVLQACSTAGVEVPRFCYHEKLSIAGNCRMCLVEVNNSKKLVASCAVPVSENLKIYTNNLRVKKARESVLEFLLANHPLDCPICDQGGECDLQDITISFGSDRGRFYEIEKRAVEDKYCGPLIKTVMTRCIHCTRCIRFISEVSGYPDLGTTGRGTRMEVGTYITKALMDELSSNIIDLCPVGALTSKPYSFTSRPWELNSVESVDVFDTLCSNIRLSVYGNKVKRILPRINEQLNEDWLSNKTRFIYDSFDLQRIASPLLNLNNLNHYYNGKVGYKTWVSISWKQALVVCLYFLNKYKLNTLFGPFLDLETVHGFKEVFSYLGLLTNRSMYNDYSASYFSSVRVKDVESYSLFLSVNSYLRNEIPLLNTRVRKSSNYYMSSFKFFGIGVGVNYFTYPVKLISNNTRGLYTVLGGKSYISKILIKLQSRFIVFYKSYSSYFFNKFFKLLFKPLFIRVDNSVSELALAHLGLNSNFFINKSSLIYSVGFNTSSDYTPLIYQGHHGNSATLNSLIVLPVTIFSEKSSHYLNLEGLVQKSHAAVSHDKLVKKDWEIFKALKDYGVKLIYDFYRAEYNYVQDIINTNNVPSMLPFWVSEVTFQANSSELNKFFKNYLFSLKILNYYWNDMLSYNSKIMAKCATVLINNNISYK
jgi:NADH dehydrogenase (ubiquinone) Fe-S protein 1